MSYCNSNNSEPSSLRNHKQKYTDNFAYSVQISDEKSSTSKPTTSTTATESQTPNTTRLKKFKALVNNEYCSYCDEGGNLLNCDRCPVSFHLLCHEPPLDHDQIPKGEFLCNKCKSKAKLLPFYNSTLTSNGGVVSNGISVDYLSSNEKLLELPISNETKYVEFIKTEKDSSLETLIKLCKSLNPRQMSLSGPLCKQLDINIPGLNRNKWWNRDYRLENQSQLVDTNGYSLNGTTSLAANGSSNGIEKETSDRMTRNMANNLDGLNGNLCGNGSAMDQSGLNSNKLAGKNDPNAHISRSRICFVCRK
jgi:hypothetical protein